MFVQKVMMYKLSLQLFKHYNETRQEETWLNLNFQQNFGQINKFVRIFDNSRIKIGRNNMINRLNMLNDQIEYDWLNLSINSYKLKCKERFLS